MTENELSKKLQSLLLENSKHVLTWDFHLLSEQLVRQGWKIKVVDTDVFYDDVDLDQVSAKKKLAILDKDFRAAAKLRYEEKLILAARNEIRTAGFRRKIPEVEITGSIIRISIDSRSRNGSLFKRLIREYNIHYDPL